GIAGTAKKCRAVSFARQGFQVADPFRQCPRAGTTERLPPVRKSSRPAGARRMGRALFSRPQILQAGPIRYLGLLLPRLLRAESQGNARADSCILIFLNGGPSHLDMWDMKPAAPPEVRGEFKPIPTAVPGIQLSEHLPRMARQMHRSTLVRSA